MKRGVTFEVPNTYGNLLLDILKPLNSLNYLWLVGEQEIYKVQNEEISEVALLTEHTILENREMLKIIDGSEYYVVFSDLKAYTSRNFSAIRTYEDFLKSDCQLVLLITDCTFVTLYCKDAELLQQLFKQAVSMSYENINYITDKDDVRVWLEN